MIISTRMWLCHFTKGSFQNKFSVKVGNLAQPAFCILGYSKHIIFFMKKSPIFLVIGDFYVIFGGIFGDFLVGTGEPLPYCD